MARNEPSTWKRFIFWDYPRASWQYDVIVALILCFIFLTPREVFRDQPKASSLVMLAPSDGKPGNSFWLEPDLLREVPEALWTERAASLVKDRIGKKPQIAKVQPIYGEENELKGYLAFAKP